MEEVKPGGSGYMPDLKELLAALPLFPMPPQQSNPANYRFRRQALEKKKRRLYHIRALSP